MSAYTDRIHKNYSARTVEDPRRAAYDIVFVVNANSKGWILDKICRVIAKYSGLHCYILYSERNNTLTMPPPKARGYFFSHFSLMFFAMQNHPELFSGGLFVWFTHFDSNKGISLSELTFALNRIDHAFTTNSSLERALKSFGVDPERVSTVLGAADPDLFLPHERRGKTVGFVSAFYSRKQPDLMLSVIERMSDVKFILVAPGPNDVENQGLLWTNWSGFDRLCALPNFEYIEAPYEEYPVHYAKMDVYVSLSELEGGPIPVVEAMMCNVIPVATRTGFADDILVGPLAEFRVEMSATQGDVERIVRRALKDRKTNVREIALDLTWEALALEILDHVRPALALSEQCPSLTENRLVQFGLGKEGRSALSGRWSKAEDSFVVAGTGEARLNFSLPHEMNGLYRLDLAIENSLSYSRQLSLHVAGVEVAATSIRRVGPQEVSMFFSVNALDQTDPQRELMINFQAMKSPDIDDNIDILRLETLRCSPVSKGLVEDKVSFTTADGNQHLLYDSWHKCERAGVWSDGPVGQVCFVLSGVQYARSIELILHARVLGAALNNGQRLDVSASVGEESRAIVCEVDSDAMNVFKVGPFSVNEGEEPLVLIAFRRQISPSPKDMDGSSTDDRSLGVFLSEIHVSESGQ
ncbi:glycosyltransferase [Hyphomonas sp.]|uniref:glycosyltransferase n=1 Tax=Hyphomonas sp. TaxID=87 RepID=UPI0025B813DD|nr:glycosyltransferase [Hyphomonas sp.]